MRSPNGLFVLAGAALVALGGTPLLAADAEWPPALKGAKDGTVMLTTDRFLDVPEAVATAVKKDGAAPFTVAKMAPTVDFAYHRDLGPDAVKRRLCSSTVTSGQTCDNSSFLLKTSLGLETRAIRMSRARPPSSTGAPSRVSSRSLGAR